MWFRSSDMGVEIGRIVEVNGKWALDERRGAEGLWIRNKALDNTECVS